MKTIVRWLLHSKIHTFWTIQRAPAKWAEIIIIILTVFIAVAAFWSAFIFQEQLIELRRTTDAIITNFRLDERAWVGFDPIVEPILMTPREGNRGAYFKYHFYPKNTGKTAARDIAVTAIVVEDVISLGYDADKIKSILERESRREIPENVTGKTVLTKDLHRIPKILDPGMTSPMPIFLTGQEPQTWVTPPAAISYLILRIDYRDEFDVPHWLTFCLFVVNHKGDLGYCRKGNDEDRNSEPSPKGKPN